MSQTIQKRISKAATPDTPTAVHLTICQTVPIQLGVLAATFTGYPET